MTFLSLINKKKQTLARICETISEKKLITEYNSKGVLTVFHVSEFGALCCSWRKESLSAFNYLCKVLGFGGFFWRPAWKTFFSFALVRIELPVNFLPCYTKCFLKCSKWGWPFKAWTPLLSEEEGEVSFLMPLKFSGSHCFLQCSYKHGALLGNHSFWTAASYLQSEL